MRKVISLLLALGLLLSCAASPAEETVLKPRIPVDAEEEEAAETEAPIATALPVNEWQAEEDEEWRQWVDWENPDQYPPHVDYSALHPEWTDFEKYLGTIACIHQTDPRYRTPEYLYAVEGLGKKGCSPACITNMFSAVFGITDPEHADAVLLDVMSLFALFENPGKYGVSVDLIERWTSDRCDAYFFLADLKKKRGGTYITENHTLVPEQARAEIDRAIESGEPLMLMGRLNIASNWDVIVELLEYLHERGQDNAAIYPFFASTGSADTDGPFRTDEGHFLTLCFHVQEYIDAGTFYILDSYQKCLPGEEVDDVIYKSRYPLCTERNRFKLFYEATHIQPPVIRCALLPEKLEELRAAEADGAINTAVRVRMLRPMILYGRGAVLICVEGRGETQNP